MQIHHSAEKEVLKTDHYILALTFLKIAAANVVHRGTACSLPPLARSAPLPCGTRPYEKDINESTGLAAYHGYSLHLEIGLEKAFP